MAVKTGDKVIYGDIHATVVAVQRNGVVITFWGRGLQNSQFIRRRVAASTLRAA